MNHTLLLLFIMIMLHTSSFLVSFGENSSTFFQDSVYKSIDILNHFIVLDADVNVLFVQKTLTDGFIGGTSVGMCRDSYDNYLTLSPALRAQKHNNIIPCDPTGVLPFYHFTNSITNDSSVSFYNGDDISKMGRNQRDLIAILLHELLHGLGIVSTVDRLGKFSSAPYFSIFDMIVFNLSSASPMYVLNDEQRNMLTDGTLSYTFDSHQYPLYSKFQFIEGTSIQHGKYGMMSYKSERHILIRTLDAFTVHILGKMGYTIKNCDNPDWSTICGFCSAGSDCVISDSERLNSFLF